jgi:hypothetical protein
MSDWEFAFDGFEIALFFPRRRKKQSSLTVGDLGGGLVLGHHIGLRA